VDFVQFLSDLLTYAADDLKARVHLRSTRLENVWILCH